MKKPILFLMALFTICAFKYTEFFPTDYKIASDFTLIIKGTSNVHDWQSEVKEINGNVSASVNADNLLNIEKCDISIPVISIKSEKGSIMDKKTRKALNDKSYPTIDYNLTSFEKVNISNKTFSANTKGNLTISGTTQEINMTITGKYLSDQSIEISGTKDLKMTDFNIDPPTALLGTMKTGDDITIEFTIKMVP